MSAVTPMQRALELARSALGSTSPNPAVGAVVARDGKIVGEGHTLPPGQSHAEVGALRQAGELARGSVLYTTLEPCCHQGRTGPCTEAIIAAGVGEVVVATIDPNPLVSGRGMELLKAAGVDCRLEGCPEAEQLYEAFAKHITTGLPFVVAKYAMSLDGKIATHTGDSKWVTGPAAREEVQRMRRECDAVLVGINTLLADDPQLTARTSDGSPRERQPLRIALDSRCRTPTTARMLGEPGETLLITSEEANAEDVRSLERAGAEVWVAPLQSPGMVDVARVMSELGRRGIVNLLVEGGGATLGSLFDAGLVDKVNVFVAPMIIGGSKAASPVEGTGPDFMRQAWQIEKSNLRQVGPDWFISGYPTRNQ